ncbi:MAG: GNAT family N-acetyltransferase [Anaerolineae bacterium]|nr:GNAT family N-acetyltransferase [Anaerolineae bacterium]
MPEFVITPAESTDAKKIGKLLQAAELPADDFIQHLRHFLVAKENGALIGAIGLEVSGEFGLLRSLVVAPEFRGLGMGQELCAQILVYAKTLGVRELYLLTTTAAEFFPKLGFQRMDREHVPASIQATQEFATICPATAACMVKKLV